MPNDLELKKDVLDELQFDSNLIGQEIGVTVSQGIVMLNGSVRSYTEKLAVLRAAKRVAGVTGLAEDLRVNLPDPDRRTDADLAVEALKALSGLIGSGGKAIQVAVRDGWVTLEGTVELCSQRTAAEDVVGKLVGVRGVNNRITVQSNLAGGDKEAALRAALKRHALLGHQEIQVELAETKVILRGHVRSFFEKEKAEEIASSVRGITAVENRIVLIL